MNNTKLLNLINLSGGSNDIVKIDNLNNMIEDATDSSTSEYTESYLDGLDTSDIDGGKGKGLKDTKKKKDLNLLKSQNKVMKMYLIKMYLIQIVVILAQNQKLKCTIDLNNFLVKNQKLVNQ